MIAYIAKWIARFLTKVAGGSHEQQRAMGNMVEFMVSFGDLKRALKIMLGSLMPVVCF